MTQRSNTDITDPADLDDPPEFIKRMQASIDEATASVDDEDDEDETLFDKAMIGIDPITKQQLKDDLLSLGVPLNDRLILQTAIAGRAQDRMDAMLQAVEQLTDSQKLDAWEARLAKIADQTGQTLFRRAAYFHWALVALTVAALMLAQTVYMASYYKQETDRRVKVAIGLLADELDADPGLLTWAAQFTGMQRTEAVTDRMLFGANNPQLIKWLLSPEGRKMQEISAIWPGVVRGEDVQFPCIAENQDAITLVGHPLKTCIIVHSR